MDLVRFEAAATELLDSLGERLSDQTQDYVRSMLWGGEEGLVADELAGALVADRTPIAPAERDLLRELLFAFDLEPSDAELYPCIHDRARVLAALNVVDPSPDPPSDGEG